MARVPWTEEQKRAFLDLQFEARDRHYRSWFPAARFDVIERGGAAIGRLIVDRGDDAIRIVDIALIPEQRGRGLGGALLRGLLDEAAGSGRPVRIHVERGNPARRLYDRLGFDPIEEQGLYELLEWRPRPAVPPVPQAKTDS
jgi:ribosomal protein S18 acetylase RimI-like enzyme